MVEPVFKQAYKDMLEDGLELEAGELLEASAHWLRHTGISEDVKTRPRDHVKADAGHASMSTTDRYVDSELGERIESGKHKKY
jgi:integrase